MVPRQWLVPNLKEVMGKCPKCGKGWNEVQKTRHHLLPKEFFGENDHILLICTECHENLETRIPHKRKFAITTYYLIVNNFLGFKAISPDGYPVF